jgi:hypothetical protein
MFYRSRFAFLAALGCLLVLAPAAAAGARSTIFFTQGDPRAPFAGQLWSVGAGGSGLKLLRRAMPTGPEGAVAVLARGGRRILCFCRSGEIDSIWLDGSHLRRIGAPPRGTRYDMVALSSTGRTFWVRGDRELLSQRANGTDRRVVAKVNINRAIIEESVAPSPAGNRVAFVEQGLRNDSGPIVKTVRLDGSGVTTAFRENHELVIATPTWSRDETRLVTDHGREVYKGTEAENQVDLLSFGIRGADPVFVTATSSESEFYPYFSPDASRIAYTFSPPLAGFLGPPDEIFTIPAAGGKPSKLVTTHCRFPDCEFSPRVIGWTPALGPSHKARAGRRFPVP